MKPPRIPLSVYLGIAAMLVFAIVLYSATMQIDPMIALSEQAEALQPSERQAAAYGLAAMGTRNAVSLLVDMLAREEDPLTLRWISQACIQHTRRYPELKLGQQQYMIMCLGDLASGTVHEAANKIAAAWTLGAIGDREAIPVLVTLHGESEAETVASVALRKLGYYSTGEESE